MRRATCAVSNGPFVYRGVFESDSPDSSDEFALSRVRLLWSSVCTLVGRSAPKKPVFFNAAEWHADGLGIRLGIENKNFKKNVIGRIAWPRFSSSAWPSQALRRSATGQTADEQPSGLIKSSPEQIRSRTRAIAPASHCGRIMAWRRC